MFGQVPAGKTGGNIWLVFPDIALYSTLQLMLPTINKHAFCLFLFLSVFLKNGDLPLPSDCSFLTMQWYPRFKKHTFDFRIQNKRSSTSLL